MSLIQQELEEQKSMLQKPLSVFDKDSDSDSDLEKDKSYIFHKGLHKIVSDAFGKFIKAIPNNYSKKEKIKKIITVIEDNLVYKAWEMKVYCFGTQIMKIPAHLPSSDDEDSKWALDAWNQLRGTVQDMKNYIKENLNIGSDTNSIDEDDSEGGSE
jgi:hypothetical protein